MTKIHHVHDRSIEHAKSRDTMAHRLITPTAPDGVRSTRGHAAGAVVAGKTVRPLPAVDTQARHGGKAKGGVVAHSWGNTPQQIANENTAHLQAMAKAYAAELRQPKTMVHDGMTRKQIAGATLNGADILGEANLPPTTVEK